MAQILIPEEFVEQYSLFRKMLQRHKQLGKESPLYIHFDIQRFISLAELAMEFNEKLELMQEEEFETRRNNLWYPVLKRIITIAEYLRAVHYKNPSMLEKWGFSLSVEETKALVKYKDGNRVSYSQKLSRLLEQYQ